MMQGYRGFRTRNQPRFKERFYRFFSMTARRWSFTLNLSERPTEIKSYLEKWNLEKVRYVLYQLEKAPTTGTYHLQGCIGLVQAMKLTGIKKIFDDDTVHVEKAKDWEKLKIYCKKEETREMEAVEWGKDGEQGRRTDLEGLAATIKEGTTLSTIADTQPGMYIKYHRGLQALRTALMRPKAIERKVILCWGKTGTGKTRLAYDQYPIEDIYSVFCIKTPWFDGYDGQKIAILDECGPMMMNHNFLKRLLDRHPMTVPVKGGSIPWNAEVIILTSNLPIEMWFQIATEDMNALKRRMSIFEFPQDKEAAVQFLNGEIPAPVQRQNAFEVPRGFADEPSAKRVPPNLYKHPEIVDVSDEDDEEMVLTENY